MPKFCLAVVLMILGCGNTFAQKDSIRLAFYNCENYFDSFRDSSINDADYTPDGPRRWSYSRFLAKRNGLFKVFASMSSPNPPEIIGLCEVENRFVLNQLCYETPLSKFEYAVVHQNSSDARGIDVALIYQRNRLRLLDFRYFNPNVLDTGLRTRSILYARFKWGEFDTLHVFVNHFPSKLGGERSNRSRKLVAGLLKTKVDSVLAKNHSASVVVAGDFNDVPPSEALGMLSDSLLVNLATPLHNAGRGSIKFDGTWELIDQLIVSRGLVNGDTPVIIKGGMNIYSDAFMLEDDKENGGQKPRRTFNGYRYNGGYSDHLPVIIELLRVL
jgi:predicted extracellular nuclease